MDSQFSIVNVSDRQTAMSTIHDYVETTHFPEQLDKIISMLLHKQVRHTLHEIADKLLQCGCVISEIKGVATERPSPCGDCLTSTN